MTVRSEWDLAGTFRALRLFFGFLLLVVVTGCQIGYLARAAYNHIKIINRQVEIERALADENLGEVEKKKLQLVLRVRDFIASDLKLNLGDNYSTYSALEQDYPSYALQAAPKWELRHHLWWFPIVGNVPYKGYPSEEDAKTEAEELKEKGFDIMVRPVSAYSTLGWFRDPILSSMLKYSDHDLVNVVIHESVHATVYLKSDADLNERLASFLGNRGTERFYAKTEGKGSTTLEAIKKENEDDALFSSFISAEVKLLKSWYIGLSPLEKKEEKRQARFRDIQDRFETQVLPKMKGTRYQGFSKRTLNNAILLGFKTYLSDFSEMEIKYEEVHGDFQKFIDYYRSHSS